MAETVNGKNWNFRVKVNIAATAKRCDIVVCYRVCLLLTVEWTNICYHCHMLLNVKCHMWCWIHVKLLRLMYVLLEVLPT